MGRELDGRGRGSRLELNKNKTRDNNVSEGTESPRQIAQGKQSVL